MRIIFFETSINLGRFWLSSQSSDSGFPEALWDRPADFVNRSLNATPPSKIAERIKQFREHICTLRSNATKESVQMSIDSRRSTQRRPSCTSEHTDHPNDCDILRESKNISTKGHHRFNRNCTAGSRRAVPSHCYRAHATQLLMHVISRAQRRRKISKGSSAKLIREIGELYDVLKHVRTGV